MTRAWTPFVILIVLLAAPGAGAQDAAPAASASPAKVTEEAPAPFKILLAAFESDRGIRAHQTLKQDFLGMIRDRALAQVTLDTMEDMIQGTSLAEASANAQRLGARHGYDLVVWGGSTGNVTTAAVTAVRSDGPGFWKFVRLGLTQAFQFHLDVDFTKIHPMVADYVFALVDMKAGNYERAAEGLRRSLAYDRQNVFGLNVLRLHLAACHLQRFTEGGVADEGRATIRELAQILDDIQRLSDPLLWGAVKACLFYAYRGMAAAEPEQAATYLAKARRAAEDALLAFKDKEYEAYRKVLAEERTKLPAL